MSAPLLFNLPEALSRLDGDKALLAMLLKVSAGDFERNLTALDDALNKGSWTELRAVAHRIKGTCGTLGFDSSRALAFELEKQCASAEADKHPDTMLTHTQDLQSTLKLALDEGLAWSKSL